jgi:hypothetical protein
VEAVFLLASSYGACLFSFPTKRVSSYWFCGFGARDVSPTKHFWRCFISLVFFGARSMRFGSDSCNTRLLVVVVGLLGPVVTRCGRAVLPCLVCGQHAPGSFLPGPAREGQEPLLRSQLVMIWVAGGCLLQGGFSE